MKKKKQSATSRRVKANRPQRDPISHRKTRRLLKTVAGAVIGGAIAGPIGVAAGAIAGASVRRGPVRKNARAGEKMKQDKKTRTRKSNRAARRRFTDIYPNIP